MEQNFGHFGKIDLTYVGAPDNNPDIPVVILRKAPLKYHDGDEDKESKVKCDAVYAYIGKEWKLAGNFMPPRDIPEEEEEERDTVTQGMYDAIVANL